MNSIQNNLSMSHLGNNKVSFKGGKTKAGEVIATTIKQGIEKSGTNPLTQLGIGTAAVGGAAFVNMQKAKSESINVEKYLDRIDGINDDDDTYEKIVSDLKKEPESREKEALHDAAIKKWVYRDNTTAKEYYDEKMQYFAAKDAAIASLNPDAKIDEQVIDAATAYLQTGDVKPDKISHVAELMRSNPAIVEKLMSYKDQFGSQIFTPEQVGEFFLNAENGIKNDPGAIFVKIESDFFKEHYQNFSGPSAALWFFLYH